MTTTVTIKTTQHPVEITWRIKDNDAGFVHQEQERVEPDSEKQITLTDKREAALKELPL